MRLKGINIMEAGKIAMIELIRKIFALFFESYLRAPFIFVTAATNFSKWAAAVSAEREFCIVSLRASA